jgi:hypothetical protein
MSVKKVSLSLPPVLNNRSYLPSLTPAESRQQSVDLARSEAESSKAVLELALLTKKAARAQASQEYYLFKCEQDRADELKQELDHKNAEMLVLLTEHKKGMPIPKRLCLRRV